MNLLLIGLKNILSKPSSTLLSILLFCFGVGIILSILLVNAQLKNKISENASGIDLVVGAKGSPLQIILASIFHVDFPTGNISLADANKLVNNRLVKEAIPLSLGDSHKGYRIVGTTRAYAEHYQASLKEGQWALEHMGAVVGANVAEQLQLSLGDELESAHGLSEGGDTHEAYPFEVVGRLAPTGKVIDDLILVSVQSVWEVHEDHEEEKDDDEEHSHDHKAEHDHKPEEDNKVTLERLGLTVTSEQLMEESITSLLIQYRSPMAAVRLPQTVNNTSNMQAASPAYETARLFNIIGVGADILNILGIVIIVLSAVSVFIALLNSLKERKYELAIMRTMGASRFQLFALILVEGLLLVVGGSFMGWLLAHTSFYFISSASGISGESNFLFLVEEVSVMSGSLFIGIFASIIPGLLTFRADISSTLSKS